MKSLNHIFRTIWSEALGVWIAVSEITKTKGKRSASSLIRAIRVASGNTETDGSEFRVRLKPIYLAVALCFAVNAQANPIGGSVVNGQASFNTSGNTLTVTNTPGTIINWQGFSINANEITHFAQQSASSTVLNHVVSNNPSVILGTLSSNGQVFLVNANGIMFGAGSTVDVAGLVATSLNLSDADFLAGRHNYTAVAGAQNVSNAGNINAQQGGQIYLIAPNVENNGIITAPNGEILLVAGNSVELVNSNDPNLRVSITAPAGEATNLGQLIVGSGNLGLFGAVVKNSGLASADSATMQGGKIVFRSSQRTEAGGTISASGIGGGEIKILSDMQSGTVDVSGTLEAKASGSGDGGFIETSAANVHIADTTRVSTLAANGKNGTWLIDPVDFTISAGGAAQTISGIGATTLQTNLGLGNVIITTDAGTTGNGDIFVNAPVTWNINLLTLSAHRNIYINANLDATLVGAASGQLSLLYGQGAVAAGNTSTYSLAPGAQVLLSAGNNFSTQLGSDGTLISYYVITSLGGQGSATGTDLQGMSLTGNYVLGADIDASLTSLDTGWNAAGGFAPIGSSFSQYFSGRFDGLGHTISNLYINRPTTDYVGLFGITAYNAATVVNSVNNVGLVNANVTGRYYVGGIAGYSYYGGAIANSYVSGSTITGGTYVGGLVGISSYNNISNTYVSGGSVTGTSNVGGLTGASNFGTNINRSHASTAVNGSSNVGGLSGGNDGTIVDSYVGGGTITGGTNTGGLVGINGSGGVITNSHYDIDNVLINAAHYVTVGGIYSGQYTTWFGNGLTLNIGSYSSLTSIGANNFRVNSVQGMQDMLGFSDNAAYTFTLGANVDLSTVPNFYVPYLAGTFNGAGYTVSNLNLNMNFVGSLGLFGHVAASSTVNNLTLTNATVTGATQVGALAGWNDGTINNVHGGGTSTVTGSGTVGGLVGYNSGAISGSDATGGSVTVTGAGFSAGGLVGNNNAGTISNSFVSGGTITGGGNVGGLVGYSANGGSIDGSHVSATQVTGIGSYIGGLVGYIGPGNATDLSNNSVDTGTVVSGADFVGGLLGADGGEGRGIYQGNAVTNTTVNGNNYVGGLIGFRSGGSSVSGQTINNHVVNSIVNGGVVSGAYVGGLIGWNGGSAANNYVSGTAVTGVSDVGGLVGYNNTFNIWGSGVISNSFVSGGSVTGGAGLASNVGGLVGYNDSHISNTYTSGGTVSGSGVTNVGGLVGNNGMSGTVNFSYANETSVTGFANVGGVVGNSYTTGSISNTFWNTALISGNLTNGIGYDFSANGGTDTGATGLTSAGMMTMSSFTDAGWSIASTPGTGSIWYILDGQMPMLNAFYVAQPPITNTPLFLSELVSLTLFQSDEDRRWKRKGRIAGADDIKLSDMPTMVCK